MGHLCSNGWGSYGKVSYCFLEDMLKNHWSSGEYPFWSSHDDGFCSGPFELHSGLQANKFML